MVVFPYLKAYRRLSISSKTQQQKGVYRSTVSTLIGISRLVIIIRKPSLSHRVDPKTIVWMVNKNFEIFSFSFFHFLIESVWMEGEKKEEKGILLLHFPTDLRQRTTEKEPCWFPTWGPLLAVVLSLQAHSSRSLIGARSRRDTARRKTKRHTVRKRKKTSRHRCVVGGAHTTLKMTKPMCVRDKDGLAGISKETRDKRAQIP